MIRKCLSMLHFAGCHRAALFAARVLVRAAVDVPVCDKRGVSDPHLAAPFFAPGPAPRGSLTPHLHVPVVRRHNASSLSQAGHSAAYVGSPGREPASQSGSAGNVRS